MTNDRGMTLIEILISIGILAFLSVYTAESIRSALISKRKYSKEIEYQSMVRDALKVIEKDVNRAFHHKNIHVELYNAAKQAQIDEKNKAKNSGESKNPTGSGQTPATKPPDDPFAAQAKPPAETFKPKQQRLFTQFIADETSMNFATLNNTRSQENEKSSDQMEVGYSLETCKSIFDKKTSSKCLWRRTSPILDDDVKDGGSSFVLIEGVEEFSLKYYSEKKQEWLKSWDSKESTDGQIKGHFPAAVEVKLAVTEPGDNKGKKPKEHSFTLVAQVRLRNNPDDKKQTSDTKANTDEPTQAK